ncbi:DUF4198 domain-containing protein [Pusillimonas sp. (ex Stolz et al. 2005)]|uniref:DUF4198 domain-containing protein n=1 Tax=Pusillimonas sp. (ex Stolz et al. 2005) TaxID=1979962 RepID=UPI0026175148|nr:DUF4198 domain-containing protein [Pusillimonas sp. (ex Stolz et al. 2005)]
MNRLLPALFAATLLVPAVAQAHDVWLEPSSTVLSGDEARITVDAGSGNDKFYYNHRPLALNDLVITSPSGKTLEPENQFTGALRSGFDVTLTEDGTYRIAVAGQGVFARWKEGDQNKRWYGKPEDLDKHVPKDAQDLMVRERVQRIETFVTKGNPTDLEPVSKGLALTGNTHPNDLYAGETAEFVLTLDGEPARNLQVEIVRDGARYRDAVEEIVVLTDDQGRFEVRWPQAGLYWLHADIQDKQTSTPAAQDRNVAYVATLEVLPE